MTLPAPHATRDNAVQPPELTTTIVLFAAGASDARRGIEMAFTLPTSIQIHSTACRISAGPPARNDASRRAPPGRGPSPARRASASPRTGGLALRRAFVGESAQ